MLAHYKWVKREKLPSVYTKEEEKRIESSVNRSSAVGKCDYAALLLVTKLGLRASDIAFLKNKPIKPGEEEILYMGIAKTLMNILES